MNIVPLPTMGTITEKDKGIEPERWSPRWRSRTQPRRDRSTRMRV